MRRNTRMTWIALLAGFVMFFGNVPYARTAPPNMTDPAGNVGYLENITFEKMKGKERVTLMISKQSGVSVDSIPGNGILVKMENMFIPDEFRKPQGEGKLTNIIRLVPVQKTADGVQRANITIELKQQVPYSVSQQGQNVLIDFNVTSLEGKSVAAVQAPSPPQTPVLAAPDKSAKPAEELTGKEKETKKYAGRLISLDFQDASIKAVFRLLAEEAGVSIVSGDDVKGNVTISMKKVPWEQALDTILEINGLTRKQVGNIISVMTLEKKKKDESDRKATEEDRIKAELTAKKAEQERLEERGKLQQIAIEAKIVLATDTFVRDIGIIWGGATTQRLGNNYYGITGGTNLSGSRNLQWQLPVNGPDGLPFTAAAVNLPAAVGSPSLGFIIGGAGGVLEAQLSAMESTSQGKIISSPKITTMDNVKATIKQGQEIPYITIDKDGNRSITFKEAVLKLEVKPKVTPEGKISMEINASNDSADYAQGATLGGNPPINKSSVESKIVVQDGDTIVIGGIFKSEDTKGVSGVPWLSEIPILGWLFKSEGITKNRSQLMIFITPKILKGDAAEQKPAEQIKG